MSKQHSFNFVERIVRLVAFDNVASTLLLVWTGLKGKDWILTSAGWQVTLGVF